MTQVISMTEKEQNNIKEKNTGITSIILKLIYWGFIIWAIIMYLDLFGDVLEWSFSRLG